MSLLIKLVASLRGPVDHGSATAFGLLDELRQADEPKGERTGPGCLERRMAERTRHYLGGGALGAEAV